MANEIKYLFLASCVVEFAPSPVIPLRKVSLFPRLETIAEEDAEELDDDIDEELVHSM
ncbi:hypothetical protein S83_006092 [Arachis hypogaea]